MTIYLYIFSTSEFTRVYQQNELDNTIPGYALNKGRSANLNME